jgi:hypothetical protein
MFAREYGHDAFMKLRYRNFYIFQLAKGSPVSHEGQANTAAVID